VTPDQACAHPNWVMGRKISVDSATMMNKGLEVIEAHWLFGAPAERIEVVIHPQSVVHSMVEYVDGSVLAQLGNPDMRTPIAHALAWPERIDAGVYARSTSFASAGSTSSVPTCNASPACARLRGAARRRRRAGALNAANEVAVAPSSRAHRLPRHRRVIEAVPGRACPDFAADSLDAVLRRRCAGARPRAPISRKSRLPDEPAQLPRSFVLALGLLITVHELGHYWSRAGAASRCCASRSASASRCWVRRPGRDQHRMGARRFPARRLRQDARRARGPGATA
jgi:hypothetical protein